MNKLVILAILASATFTLNAQKYFTKTGTVKFTSITTLEDIKAENRKVVSVLDSGTGALEFSMLMKGFDFPNDEMEKHFNETYVESDKYPKATFKGKITDIANINFSKDGSYTVHYTGKLTIKDVTKDVSGTATFVIKGGKITATGKMEVSPADYHIVIPNSAAANIAKVITVDIIMDYKRK